MEVERIIKDIKSLKIQGARTITVAALKTVKNVLQTKGLKEFKDLCDFFAELRPTQSCLYNAMKIAKESPERIQDLIEYFSKVDELIAKTWWHVIEDGDVIITHCHSSEEMALLKKAKEMGRDFKVFVTETRPKMQGIKSAKELLKAGIKVKYIVDDAVGFFKDEFTKMIVGCDSIKKEGIYNKIGTYLMALMCKDNAIPVIFVGDSFKIDEREQIIVEMRDPREIIEPEKIKGAEILNPAFDCTPWYLVNNLLTEHNCYASWSDVAFELPKIHSNF